jgi:hypothetical protein
LSFPLHLLLHTIRSVCTLLSFLSSLFTPSATNPNACLLQNRQYSRRTSCGHCPCYTAVPIYIVSSLLVLLYTNETISTASLWKNLFHFPCQSEELACMRHTTCLAPLSRHPSNFSHAFPLCSLSPCVSSTESKAR